MRLSRVLLAGVAVAGAVATTSAFTASNTETVADADQKAGYGSVVVTGVEVTDIRYNPVSTDASLLDNVVFTATGNVTGQRAWLTLKNGTTQVATFDTCTMTYTTATVITCTAGTNPAITSFDTVGLTVSHATAP